MVFELLKTAEERRRRFNGHELVADVLAGATFINGISGPRRAPNNDRGRGRCLTFGPGDLAGVAFGATALVTDPAARDRADGRPLSWAWRRAVCSPGVFCGGSG